MTDNNSEKKEESTKEFEGIVDAASDLVKKASPFIWRFFKNRKRL